MRIFLEALLGFFVTTSYIIQTIEKGTIFQKLNDESLLDLFITAP